MHLALILSHLSHKLISHALRNPSFDQHVKIRNPYSCFHCGNGRQDSSFCFCFRAETIRWVPFEAIDFQPVSFPIGSLERHLFCALCHWSILKCNRGHLQATFISFSCRQLHQKNVGRGIYRLVVLGDNLLVCSENMESRKCSYITSTSQVCSRCCVWRARSGSSSHHEEPIGQSSRLKLVTSLSHYTSPYTVSQELLASKETPKVKQLVQRGS